MPNLPVHYQRRYRGPLVASLVRSIWDSVAGNERDDPKIMEESSQFVDWSSKPYHQTFLDWLYDEADKPVPIKEKQVDLIIGISRANTFKEIRRYLQDQESRANSILNRERNG